MMASSGMIGGTIGHYRIVRKLGEGGMGQVYLAHDTRLDRPVALKFVRTMDRPAGGQQLLREARAASALNHPNVCTIHEVGEFGADACIVMEYVEGETLADRIAARRMPGDEVITIATQIAAALAHAHGRGVVHRDLKSANVVIGPESRVKVLDFGLSRRALPSADPVTRPPDTVTEVGVIAGTLAYMSPEVLRGARADATTDLWALAVTLYEMCASRRPFDGATPFELVAAILDGAPVNVPANVPAPLARILARGLSKNPYARFPDAVAFREALEAASRHEDDSHVPVLRTLVVLPFENLSSDDSQEFFADGMTEAITAAIARLGSIRVISRTSAMQFKHDRPPIPEIARRLGAEAVVEGSVMRAGGRVRVSAQLIDARSDQHLWSDRLDCDLTDVLDLQDQVAVSIVKGIRSRLVTPDAGGDRPTVQPRDTRRSVDPEAYVEYLRGRHAWTRRTPGALRQAIACYERAIERDPTYARAYAGIAESHGELGFFGASAPRNAFPPATAAARRALELDPSTASAHIVLGYVATHYRCNFREAADAFEEGLRLEPDNPNGRHWYALLLTSRGTRDAAIQQLRLAEELDPLSAIVRAATGLVLHFFGEFEAAVAECRDALDLNPDFAAAKWTLAKTLLGLGDASAAVELLQPLADDSRWIGVLGDYGRALGHCGRRDEARAVLATLTAAASRAYVRPYDVALVHMGLQEHDAALEQLERACGEGGNWLNYLWLDPAFAALRDHPRFTALLRQVADGSAASRRS
jgi:serine/threonine protein kinase/tetratricopeptide (TPR) repeat protein